MKRVIVYTQAWDSYIDLYKKYALPSISSSITALQDMGVRVDVRHYTCRANEGLMQTVRDTCSDPEDYVFFLPPDTIFSDDSLYNLYTEFEGEQVSVAIPHLRINQENVSLQLPIDREALIKYCFQHLHYTADSSYKDKLDNLWHKGIFLRKHSMNHCLPTVYLCNFMEEDLVILQEITQHKYFWDSSWLDHCYNKRKLRVVGSARLACCFEMTASGNNRPPLVRGKSQWHMNCLDRFTACGICTYSYD